MGIENVWALVVEDDAHSLMAISTILRELGIAFKRNTTGMNVIPQLHAMSTRPHFILLDTSLPLIDSFELISYIRRDPQLCTIPIICLSDTHSSEDVERARKGSCNGLIHKPLPRRQFADLIRRLLNGEQLWLAAV